MRAEVLETRNDNLTPSASRGRLRVAHIAHSLELGGAEKLLVEFAKHVDRNQFDLQFLALTSDGIVGEQLRATGCGVTVLNGRDGLRPGLIYQLARFLRKQRIDIVHTHLDRPHIYGTIAARLVGIRCIVHTRHGQADNLSPRQHRLVKSIARWTQQFVCVSEDAARLTAESHGIPAERVSTIWNGIDLSQFALRELDATGPVVTVARLMPEKDLATLMRAAAIAVKVDPTLRFEIAGEGPCRVELEALSKELGLQDHVRLLGAVADVSKLLARAGMFVLSSRTEGIALAVLEAQASGVPVIATRVGGNMEVIADGENGLLVSAQSPEELAAAILRLRGDAVLGKQLGQQGRRRMEQRFDVTQMVGRYQLLYRALLDVDGEVTRS